MKTLYLKAATKELLISDISKIIDGYSGEMEFSYENNHCHYIGQLAKSVNPETGEITEWIDGYHANLLVPDNFNESTLSTIVTPPTSPAHSFL
jgi:hypothetical protein